jgi:hypothetical protein
VTTKEKAIKCLSAPVDPTPPDPDVPANLAQSMASLEERANGTNEKATVIETRVTQLQNKHDDLWQRVDKMAQLNSDMFARRDGKLDSIVKAGCEVEDRLDGAEQKVTSLENKMSNFDFDMTVTDVGDVREKTFDLFGRVVNVEQKVGRLEKKMDTFADQSEKIVLLENKLKKFASYFDKIDTIENQMSSFSGLRSRITNVENKVDIHDKKIEQIVICQEETTAELNEKLADVGDIIPRFEEKIEKGVTSHVGLDETVVKLNEEVISLDHKVEELCGIQNKATIADEEAQAIVDNEFVDFNKKVDGLSEKVLSLDKKVEELPEIQAEAASSIELQIMGAVDRAVANFDEKIQVLTSNYVRTRLSFYERMDRSDEKMCSFEISIGEKLSKLEKQMCSFASLQDKITMLDESLGASHKSVNADLRKELACVESEFSLLQYDIKTLFKDVDALNSAISCHKKKFAYLEEKGLELIPKPLAQA